MGHYVYLGRWTAQGAKELKDSPARSGWFAKEVAALGGKLVTLLHTMGPYDFVIVVEFPNDEAANLAALRAASRGFVSTVTLKGWTDPEYAEMLRKL